MDYEHPHLLTTLSSMEELAETFPVVFQSSHKKVIKEFVVKKLLVVDRVSQPTNPPSVLNTGELSRD